MVRFRAEVLAATSPPGQHMEWASAGSMSSTRSAVALDHAEEFQEFPPGKLAYLRNRIGPVGQIGGLSCAGESGPGHIVCGQR